MRGFLPYPPLVLAGLLAGVFLAGCGGTPEPLLPDLPKPGTMVTLSVQPLAPPTPVEKAAPNLLKDGDFQAWWAGAPAPKALTAPDAAFSKLERVQAGVKQVWEASDTYEDLAVRARARIENLPPGEYEIELTATGPTAATVSVGLWLDDPSGAVELDDDFIQIPPAPGLVKRYTKRVTLGAPGSLLLTAHAGLGLVRGAEITWGGWRVSPVGGNQP